MDSSRVLDVDSGDSGTIQTEVDMEHVDQSSYLFTDLYLLVDLAKSYSGNNDHQNQEPSGCNVVPDVEEKISYRNNYVLDRTAESLEPAAAKGEHRKPSFEFHVALSKRLMKRF